MTTFLWVVFPYLCLAVFVVGIDDAPYAMDPALDGLRTPPTDGCAPAGSAPHTSQSLGPTIPVGAPR